MSDKFRALTGLGAGDFEHLDGSLIEHLNGTRDLLLQWGATSELQDAGLYHAAYGTAGFSQNLVSTNQRDKIAAIIGEASEEIVYQYCACDRNVFFSRIRQEINPDFPNRFTGVSYRLSGGMLRNFCELTAANEIEIAIGNPAFIEQHGKGLGSLFISMAPYLTQAAQNKAAKVFGGSNA
ncbi:DUF6817 domain-containing protein [uncultured Pseudoteredinibacter sp.]|uniref:DUF6817 domain-containing protein n=1 Tax=uncultured Pseudoteredinibacter sp. TaxID=1641701 RepID=UPI002603A71B|nr:hypothetical protein [uncultured Pseudoteredinibacter sp.]